MKKKSVVLFGTLALLAVLSLNVSKSHDLKPFSLKNLLILSEAQSEGPGGGPCEPFGCFRAPYYICVSQDDPSLAALHCYPW